MARRTESPPRRSFGQRVGQDRAVLIRDYALRIVARFVYSERGLREKIGRRFPDAGAEADQVIADFKRWGYIDDEKNAVFLADRLRGRGYGPGYIRAALRRKGFSARSLNTDIECGVGLEKWYMKKTAARRPRTRSEWARLFMFLRSKGFGSEEIADFLRTRGMYDGE